MQIQKSVFISYRRTNMPIAQTVRLSLKPYGFDVFFDYDSLDSGDFSQTILNQIGARAHFIVILTPSALERCTDPNDWVRKEIEEAIKLKRNIIPIFFEGFDFAKEQHVLKGDYLPLLPNYTGINIYWDYFDEGMERLQGERFLNRPLELLLHPTSTQEVQQIEVAQKISDKISAPTEKQLKAQEYFERGVAKYHISDWLEAIEHLTLTIMLDENFAEAYFKRGQSHWNKGDKEQSLADYEKAIEIDTQHPKINIMQAYILREKNGAQAALEEAEKGVAANPELDEAYFTRGWVRSALNDPEGTIADYTQAIELNPNYAMAYNNRGIAYHELKQYDNALQEFEKAVELNPNYALAYNNCGELHFQMSNYDMALYHFRKADELQAHYPMTVAGLAVAYHALDEIEEAQNLWRQLLEQDEKYMNIDWVERELNWHKTLLEEARKLFTGLQKDD